MSVCVCVTSEELLGKWFSFVLPTCLAKKEMFMHTMTSASPFVSVSSSNWYLWVLSKIRTKCWFFFSNSFQVMKCFVAINYCWVMGGFFPMDCIQKMDITSGSPVLTYQGNVLLSRCRHLCSVRAERNEQQIRSVVGVVCYPDRGSASPESKNETLCCL